MYVIALVTALVLQGAPQASGKLEIKDLKVGTGRAAQAKDIVTVDYRGTLVNGTEFDSSKGKQPFSFILGAGQVIKGWDQGVAGMKVGGKRHLVIPADLAYGDRAAGDKIPPKSTLVFDVELLRIDRAGDPEKIEMKVLKSGEGRPAVTGDELVVNWKGAFLNGYEFVDTYKSKQPAKLSLGSGGVPKGITELLTGIKKGEKRHGVLPYQLAYGEQGSGNIPGYATLVLDVEAVSVMTKAEALARDKKMLKIEDLTVGTGKEAKDGDTVEVHYTGMFPDGKKFDSSHDRNQPMTVQLGQGHVIRGFDLGIQGMKVGGKRRVTIPPDLGYGARGAGGVIPPNQTLVFELELISVK